MKIVIAGGGTGGHLFPGIALAEEFKARYPKNLIVFVGTKKGIEQRVIPEMGYELKTISAVGLLGGSPIRKLAGVYWFLVGLCQALFLLRSLRPDLVLGTGGYASAPVIFAAWLLGFERAICEQNTIPGLTNRTLGKIVKKIFIAFEESRKFFPSDKTYLTGNPVRNEFLRGTPFVKKEGDRFTILVLGGSQGARSINQAMTEALDTLAPLQDKIEIIHQTGFADFSWVKEAYEKKSFKAEVESFIAEMAPVYQSADLVVSRAGAITIAETLACGKPSVLIPYPYAAYNHQELNARTLADKGAARMILDRDLSGTNLGEEIIRLVNHPNELNDMAGKAQILAQPEAAKAVADHYFSPGGKQ